MKVLLVWPNRGETGLKSIGIAMVSALLKRQGHEVRLFDTTFFDLGLESADVNRKKIRIFKDVDMSAYDMSKKNVDMKDILIKELENFKPDVVGVSALFNEKNLGFKISKIVKEWEINTIVLWGNKQATMSYEEILNSPYVDYVCIGEGIQFISEFMDGIFKGRVENINNLAYIDNNGEIVKNPLSPFFQDLDSLPFLDWEIFDKRQFVRAFDGKVYIAGDHMLSWGCPNSCTYCINNSYRRLYKDGCIGSTGKFIRNYSVNRIVEELEYLKNKWDLTFYKFQDEDFCLKSIAYLEEFKEKYVKHVNLPFTCMANAKNATYEKLSLMKVMNCVSISIGIENGNEEIRTKVLKRRETKEEIIRAIKDMNSLGIRTSAFNMLGLPFDSRETIMETIALNKESEVRYPNCGFFFPLDKTELKVVSVENNFFQDGDSLADTNSPCLNLTEISKEELIKLRERFLLYIKMPDVFYPYIERSEVSDAVGKNLLNYLYQIYEKCVFEKDGFWDASGEEKLYLKKLDSLLSKIKVNTI